MSENKDLTQLWKDYTEKANSFANWFTSILISNFVYLFKATESEKLGCWGKWSLGLSVSSLIAMFLFKVMGVCAARKRHDLELEGQNSDRDTFLKKIETLKKWLFYLFAGFGIVAISISGFILLANLTK